MRPQHCMFRTLLRRVFCRLALVARGIVATRIAGRQRAHEIVGIHCHPIDRGPPFHKSASASCAVNSSSTMEGKSRRKADCRPPIGLGLASSQAKEFGLFRNGGGWISRSRKPASTFGRRECRQRHFSSATRNAGWADSGRAGVSDGTSSPGACADAGGLVGALGSRKPPGRSRPCAQGALSAQSPGSETWLKVSARCLRL